MSIRFDEKGKYFTEVVTKNAHPVIIQTATHLVRGELYVSLEERLIDVLNGQQPFLAVTHATLSDLSGVECYRSEFMVVNCAEIIWVIPVEEIDGGPQVEDQQGSSAGLQPGGGEA